jgi:hypothetical protein
MIEELMDQIREFPGEENRTRCFNHIVALVAVRVVRQFDVPKKDDMDGTNDAEKELRELAEGSDIEESVSQTEWESTELEGDDEDDVDSAEWQDDETTVLDCETLNTSLKPGRMLMIKVCREQKKRSTNSPQPCSSKRSCLRSSIRARSCCRCGLRRWKS